MSSPGNSAAPKPGRSDADRRSLVGRHPRSGSLRRPRAGRSASRAVVVSYPPFHRSGMATVCPITTRPAKYRGEIAIPSGHAGQTLDGVILVHQLRTVDLRRVTSAQIGGSPQAITDPAIRRQVRQALAHHSGSTSRPRRMAPPDRARMATRPEPLSSEILARRAGVAAGVSEGPYRPDLGRIRAFRRRIAREPCGQRLSGSPADVTPATRAIGGPVASRGAPARLSAAPIRRGQRRLAERIRLRAGQGGSAPHFRWVISQPERRAERGQREPVVMRARRRTRTAQPTSPKSFRPWRGVAADAATPSSDARPRPAGRGRSSGRTRPRPGRRRRATRADRPGRNARPGERRRHVAPSQVNSRGIASPAPNALEVRLKAPTATADGLAPDETDDGVADICVSSVEEAADAEEEVAAADAGAKEPGVALG